MNSINNGMNAKKLISPYFIAINPNYYNKKEDNNINNFNLYSKLLNKINIIFLKKFLTSHNCRNELICHFALKMKIFLQIF